MEICIFAKKRQTRQGKIFYNYLTTLHKKDGSELSCDVKFREDCGEPKAEKCPMNIVVDKGACNLVNRKYTRRETDEFTGEVTTVEGIRPTLWVSAWAPGAPYVDHSMDDFE